MLSCYQAGVFTIGAGADHLEAAKPLDIGNLRLIAVCENEFGAATHASPGVSVIGDDDDVERSIAEGRGRGYKVIVVAHGGSEEIPIPPPYLRRRYRRWIRHGAHLVIGNHPHVVQGAENYLHGRIYYSLGNFLFVNEQFQDPGDGNWSLAVVFDVHTGQTNEHPVRMIGNRLELIKNDPSIIEEFEKLCDVLQSPDYFGIYDRICQRLYGERYRRLAAANKKDAALLLHYLRCDAHRHLLQEALSLIMEERYPSRIEGFRISSQPEARTRFRLEKGATNDSSGPIPMLDSMKHRVKFYTIAGEAPLDVPPLPKTGDNQRIQHIAFQDIVEDANKLSRSDLVYLASADQWLGMEPFFKKNDLMQCDVFYSVIGGLGGLNFLPHLRQLQKIVFYDVNAYAARIVDLQLQLIASSETIDEYISLVYQRPFDRHRFTFENQLQYLSAPIDPGLSQKLTRSLSAEAMATYRYFYHPYIKYLPNPLFKGPTIHCTHLLPFFESNKITDPLVHPFNNCQPNINTFYVGKGWLKNDQIFSLVRRRLTDCAVEVRIGDIAQIIPEGSFPGIYTTNIYNTDKNSDFCGYLGFIGRFKWMVGYDDFTDFQVHYYVDESKEGMVPYEAVVGANNRDPHANCCAAIDRLIDLNSHPFLEIIEPHPTEGMNYGFRLYRGQQRISVADYLNKDCRGAQIIVLHILLGAGVDHRRWRRICEKAVSESARFVLLFEHRRECTDWPEWDVHSDNLLSHRDIDRYLYSLDYRWRKFGTPNLQGDVRDIRNLFYFLDKKQKESVPASTNLQGWADNMGTALEAKNMPKSTKILDLGGEDENWFSHAAVFQELLADYKGVPDVSFLELGSWKGRSALWLVENILTGAGSKIFCVDVWDVRQWNPDAKETIKLLNNKKRMSELKVEQVYDIFMANTAHLRDKIIPIRMRTTEALHQFYRKGMQFHFIYIDADHSEEAVFSDFSLSLACLKPGGIIFLDDLSWNSVKRAVKRIKHELGLQIIEVLPNGAFYRSEPGRPSHLGARSTPASAPFTYTMI
ncbi:MAG: CapA family protein [Deltaproteobacteria bacterium]|nr:CapA family protein [Deltaproteobacteria bacterium]